jgi:hypothetical protein
MKYIKTFENYKVNENEVNPISSEINLTKAESVITQKVESFTEEEKNKAIKELTTLAGKLKLSLGDMTDAAKVEEALSKNESELKLKSVSVDESLKEWWGKTKDKFYKWLTNAGIGGLVGGLITLAIGGSMDSQASNLADYTGAVVDMNTAVIVGGSAMVISLVATLVGLKGKGASSMPVTMSPKQASQIIKNREKRELLKRR